MEPIYKADSLSDFNRQRRVVVTGVGLISPLGVGTEPTWVGMLAGKSGIAAITAFDASRFPCRIAGEVKGFRAEDFLERKDIKKTGRFIQFAIAAARAAVAQACLTSFKYDVERIGVYVGSGNGGFEIIEREHSRLLEAGPSRVSPFFVTASIINLAAGQIGIRFGARGPNLACATACTSGAHAIGEAFRIIQYGDADLMICGGTEAVISPLSIAGFAAMKALSTRNDEAAQASRPWDKDRDGFVVGEGAGILVLEERAHALSRGARILAELVGYARNSDAYHAATPPRDGDGILRVMKLALKDAALPPCAIQYINAHATSTQLGDKAEATAIATLFKDNRKTLAVSSTKSMTGHLLGAAGSLEAGITVLALRDQIVPPTINLVSTEVDYGLNLTPLTAKQLDISYAMTNSFGFGGGNACLIFKAKSNL